MSSSSSEGHPDNGWLFSDSDEDIAIHDHYFNNTDWFGIDYDEVDLDYVRELRSHRCGRRVLTWLYSGDVLKCITGTHIVEQKNWRTLPADVRNTCYIDFCRCSPAAFEELLDVVGPHLPDTAAVIPSHRTYSKRVKLLVTLFFLAHCPTLRALQDTVNIPHNSIRQCVLEPTLKALEEAICVDPHTKTVMFPRAPHDVRRVMRGFSNRLGLPTVGAIGGSLIPQRKPSSAEAGGDADAYWSYKGHTASLLLAICDADGLFLYVNAGAPGTVGVAGLWGRSDLCAAISDGLIDAAEIELSDGEEVRVVKPFLVGDAAFPLGPAMLKVYDTPAPAQAALFHAAGKGRFNRCVINCRREIERSFGRLKGRWGFCRRNVFVRDPATVRRAVRVCCGLHNFVERLGVDYNDEWAQQGPVPAVVNAMQQGIPQGAVGHGNAGRAAGGRELREFMTRYLQTTDVGQ